ncbi:hypothetical protein H5073_07110 [Shewanella sp. SR44-3]|nr:hypothetical protein [Shewanella sp. SR44-3]
MLSTLKSRLASSQWLLIIYASSAAFMTYFSMYAFRKPFTATAYLGVEGWEFALDYKVALVLSQVFGYLLSKFIGIKVVSEMPASRRACSILILVLLSEVALIAFAVLPAPYNVVCLFFNGLPLGMIWGLVFAFLEGRRVTEVLGACLSITFIVASGWVRSIGRYLIVEWQVPELWMPALTGVIFIPLLLISVLGLAKLPPPDAKDIAMRAERVPMDAKARWAFFSRYALGLVLLVLSFTLLTGLRDFRDNFEAELWQALGFGRESNLFAYTGVRVALLVSVVLGAMVLIRSNIKALFANHFVILFGIGLFGLSTWCFELGLLEAKTWMIMLGAGIYIAYIPYNCFLYDRLIASLGVTANAGFLIYLSDSAGYLGSVGILLYRTFSQADMSWLDFFITTTYGVAVVSASLVAMSLVYFSGILSRRQPDIAPSHSLISIK